MNRYNSTSIFDWNAHIKNPDAHHKDHKISSAEVGSTDEDGFGAVNIDSAIIDIGSPAFVGIAPVDVAPDPPAGGWVIIDVSAYVPIGATGVSLHVENTSANTSWTFNVRKTGSTDDRKRYISVGVHKWMLAGLDASRQFDLHVQANSVKYVKVWINGYYTAAVHFFDNGISKAPAAGSWGYIDISGNTIGTDIAIGAIFEVSMPFNGNAYNWGLRCNGSTDDRKLGGTTTDINNHFMIGVDSNEICEGYVQNAAMEIYLIGYFKLGVVFRVNASNVSLSGTNVYTDLPTISNADGIILEVLNNDAGYNRTYALRKNGTSENISRYCAYHNMAAIEADANGVIEGEINDTDVDFFVIGYFTDTSAINKINALKTELSADPSVWNQDITIGDDGARIFYNALDHIWKINGIEKMHLTSAGILELASPLSLAYGGTAKALTVSNGGIVYTDADSMEILSGTATALRALFSQSNSAPIWSTPTYPNTATLGKLHRGDGTNVVESTFTIPDTMAINTILYASSANVLSALATGNSGVLVTSAAGVPSISTTLPNGLTFGTLGVDWDIGDGRMIQADKIRARDGDGLALYEDGGSGIFIKDGGDVGIGISPDAKLDVAVGGGTNNYYVVLKFGSTLADSASIKHRMGYNDAGQNDRIFEFVQNYDAVAEAKDMSTFGALKFGLYTAYGSYDDGFRFQYMTIAGSTWVDAMIISHQTGNITIGSATMSSAKLGIDGGLHVGGLSDPGDNNLLVDGYTISPNIYGSIADNGDITIEGTLSATKTTSYVIMQPSGGYVGVGCTPGVKFDVGAGTIRVHGSGAALLVNNVANSVSEHYLPNAGGDSFLNAVGGNLGIGGITSPTARLHLPASTAAANTASLKITAGVVASTPVTGNIESDGTHLYWTDSGGTRRQLDN